MAAIGLSFQGTWDASTGVYPTTRPPEGTGQPLEEGDLFAIDVNGNIDSIDYFIGDWIVLNPSLVWVRVPNVVDWNAIYNVPASVTSAMPAWGRSTADLNTFIASQVVGLDSANANLPHTDAANGTLMAIQNLDVTSQLVIAGATTRMWIREYRASAWSAWRQLGTMAWDGTTLDITL